MTLEPPITQEDIDSKTAFRRRDGELRSIVGPVNRGACWRCSDGHEVHWDGTDKYGFDSRDLIERIPPEPAMDSQVKKRAYIRVSPQEATFTDKGGVGWNLIRFGADLVKITPQVEGQSFLMMQTDAAQLREIAEFAEHGN